MKKYLLRSLAVAVALLALGACGSVQVIDQSNLCDSYRSDGERAACREGQAEELARMQYLKEQQARQTGKESIHGVVKRVYRLP